MNIEECGNLYLGVDIGRKIDSTFIVGVEEIEHVFYVRVIKEFKLTPFEMQRNFISSLLKKSNVLSCFIDETGMGMQITEQLRGDFGIKVRGITFTAEVKERMMQNLRILFEKKQIRIPNHQQLIVHLHAIKRKVTDARHVKYEADSSEPHHSDAAWALALACYDKGRKISWHVAGGWGPR